MCGCNFRKFDESLLHQQRIAKMQSTKTEVMQIVVDETDDFVAGGVVAC